MLHCFGSRKKYKEFHLCMSSNSIPESFVVKVYPYHIIQRGWGVRTKSNRIIITAHIDPLGLKFRSDTFPKHVLRPN